MSSDVCDPLATFLKNYFCSTAYGEWHRLFPFGYSINEPYVTDMIQSMGLYSSTSFTRLDGPA